MPYCNQLFCLEIPLLWRGDRNSKIFDGVVKNVNLKKAYDQYFLKVILFPTKTLAAEKSLSIGEGFRVRKKDCNEKREIAPEKLYNQRYIILHI